MRTKRYLFIFRLIPLIQGDVPLSDSVFSASSTLNAYNAPFMARIPANLKNSMGSWSPGIDDQMQYLQISFPEPEPIFGVVMAGSPDFDNYVTLFKVNPFDFYLHSTCLNTLSFTDSLQS